MCLTIMNTIKSAKLVLVGVVLLLLSSSMYATHDRDNERITWNKKQSRITGLYNAKNYFVTQGLSFGFYAMYYYGDVDNVGVAFNGGFNKENVSYGGSLTLAYHMPISKHCALRTTLSGGTLSGNNKMKFEALSTPRYDFRKFNSAFIQPAAGIEYYPMRHYGLFLYGGIAVTCSYIYDYDFLYEVSPNFNPGVLDRVQGQTFGILPMVQLGLGYSWNLSPSWMLTFEVMVQEGLCDQSYMNLDAFPLAASQNDKHVHVPVNGNDVGFWTDKDGKRHLHWNDGWFQVGLTFTYRWDNCAACRLTDKPYKHMLPSSW